MSGLPAEIRVKEMRRDKIREKVYNLTILALSETEWYANYTQQFYNECDCGRDVEGEWSADFEMSYYPNESHLSYEDAIKWLKSQVENMGE